MKHLLLLLVILSVSCATIADLDIKKAASLYLSCSPNNISITRSSNTLVVASGCKHYVFLKQVCIEYANYCRDTIILGYRFKRECPAEKHCSWTTQTDW